MNSPTPRTDAERARLLANGHIYNSSLASQLERGLSAANHSPPHCEWSPRQICDFTTACGHTFKGDPWFSLSTLGFTFCPFCGKTIKEL